MIYEPCMLQYKQLIHSTMKPPHNPHVTHIPLDPAEYYSKLPLFVLIFACTIISFYNLHSVNFYNPVHSGLEGRKQCSCDLCPSRFPSLQFLQVQKIGFVTLGPLRRA